MNQNYFKLQIAKTKPVKMKNKMCPNTFIHFLNL